MDFREIRKLLHLVERANIEEIEIEEEGKRIRVRKSGQKPAPQVSAAPPMPQATSIIPLPTPSPPASPAPQSQPESGGREESGGETIDAPMVGTFYRAPAPDADAFIKKGDKVAPETVVCIVEAMKVMNEIKAGKTGTIAEILVENATAVEYGQPLFRVAME